MTHNYGNCGIGDNILRPDDVNERITNLEDVNVKQTIWEEITAKGIDETVDNFNGKTTVDTTIWDSSPYNSEAKKVSSGGAYTGEDIFTASGTHIKAIIDANGDYLLSGIPNPAIYPRYSIVYNRKGTTKEFGEEEIPSSQILQTIETPPMIRDVENGEVSPKNDGDDINTKTGGLLDNIRNTDVLYVNRIEEKKDQVITVAKNGGDFTTIQAAVDSITDAGPSKRYLIKISPGTYVEDVVNKSYIDFTGGGLENTILNGTLVLGATFRGEDMSIQTTITTSKTILDASSIPAGSVALTNFLITVRTSTAGVKPIIISVNKNAFTTDSFQMNYFNTSNSVIAGDTNLVDLQGGGFYIFTESLFSLTTNQLSGNVNCINNNNAGITEIGLVLHLANISNANWNDTYSFWKQTNNTSNKHIINSLNADITGAGLGICKAINNDSGGALVRILSSRIFVNNFTERCILNAEQVGDIIDFSFSSKNQEVPDAEAFCGIETALKIMAKNDGEQIFKNTDLVDLDMLIGTPTNRSLQDMFNIGFNAGWVSGNDIIDNLDGTATIELGTGYIRISNDEQAPLKSFDLTEVITNINDGIIIPFDDLTVKEGDNLAYVDYNSSAPIIKITQTTSTILDNENNLYEIWSIFREGINLHITPLTQKAKNVNARSQQRIYSLNTIERANSVGGLIISESGDGNRNVLVSASLLWVKLSRIPIIAIDTAVSDTFDRYYRIGSVFTKTTGNTTWDNTNYNDITLGLVVMTNNRYSFQDFWAETDNQLVSVYGTAQFTNLADAINAPRVLAPPRLTNHALYIGRIAFQKGYTIAQAVLTAFGDVLFGASAVNIHNNLAGLQGGASAEYYHLNAIDYGNLTNVNAQLSALLTTGTPDFVGANIGNSIINGNEIRNEINSTIITRSNAILDDLSTALRVFHTGNGISLNGFGTKLTIEGENDSGQPKEGAVFKMTMTNVSAGNEVSTLGIDLLLGGAISSPFVLTPTDLTIPKLIANEAQIDDVNINSNIIKTIITNGDLKLLKDGSGKVILGDDLAITKYGLVNIVGTGGGALSPIVSHYINTLLGQPIYQTFPVANNGIALYFDMFNSGSTEISSYSGSNFAIKKISNTLGWYYDSGITAGNTTTLNAGLIMDASGLIGIANASPNNLLTVGNSTRASNSYITIDALATQQTAIELRAGGVSKWIMYKPGSSNDIRWYDGVGDRMILQNGGSFFLPNIASIGAIGSLLRYDVATGQIRHQTSSQRYKTPADYDNPDLLSNSISLIEGLKLAKYDYLDGSLINQTSFIAEDVEILDPNLVYYKKVNGELLVEGYNNVDIVPKLVRYVQYQKSIIDEHGNIIFLHDETIANLCVISDNHEGRINKLEEDVALLKAI